MFFFDPILGANHKLNRIGRMKIVSNRAVCLILFVIFAAFVCVTDSSAQIKASERATTTQLIDGTLVTIDYARPSRRGRDPIFGGFVHWGEVWSPGADRATRIEFSKDVTLDGNEVPAGSYSLWIVVNDGDWEIALSEKDSLFHLPHLVLDDEQIRFFVTPRDHVEEMETLSFSFPSVYSDGALLRMHWGKTFVEMRIRVEPSRRMRVTEEEAAPYVGKYLMTVEADPNVDRGEVVFELNLTYENEYLSGIFYLEWPDGPPEFAFAYVAEAVFNPVQMMDDNPAGLWEDIFFEFEVDNAGNVTKFEARSILDDLWMSGTRID